MVALVLATAVGSILVEFPPSLPRDFWSLVVLFFGAALLVFAALVIPFLPEAANRIARSLVYLPNWLRQRGENLKQPIRLIVGILAVALVVAVAAIVQRPVSGLDLEPGTLTIVSAFDESPSDPRRILINQWNQTHPDNQVVIEDAPGEPDQQHDRMVNDAMVGGQHEADVYVLDNVWMAEFIRDDYIRPFDESLRTSKDEDFLPNVLDTCKDMYGAKEGLWALPFNADAGLLFYRSGLPGVDEPTSWDGYFGESARATLAQVKSNPDIGDTGVTLEVANAAQLANEEILTVTAFEAIWAAGGEVVNRDGKLVLSVNENAVEFDDQALEALRNLAAAYVDREITLPDADAADEDSAITAFNDGRALFMRNWPVAYDKLRNPSDKDAIPFEVAALPGPSVLGGQNLAVSKWSEKPRAAQALIEFLASPASQLILFEVGGFAPTRPEVYANASQISRRYAQDLRSKVESARHRPVTPHYIEFSREFRAGILRAIRNNGEFEPDFPQKLASTVRDG
ncbi:MAG: extracellular solute-binding protein [Pseudonocardia sp.]